jgi:hypothetical protein
MVCYWAFTHLALAVPTLPTINTNNVVNITNFGAVSSTTLTNTTAIQNAINSAATTNGGCTVEIPAGTYLSGPLTMKSKVNLQVDGGATLMMLPMSSWSGTTTFILGTSLQDVEISGSGTIDGQGAGWWSSGSRPNFIEFSKTVRILIQNVKMQNPPTFHLMLKGNNGNITIQGINIDTDPTSPNTDGMDIGSTNILIQNCHISDGDDNIEIGGSSGYAADIMITNCMFGHGHGVSVGGYTQAGVSNVTVINCTFTNTDNAIRMKSNNDRGGIVQSMFYYNIGMTNIKYAPILIYSYYPTPGNPTTAGITPSAAEGTALESLTSTMPTWRNIVISNVTATAGQPGMIWARTEWPATNITLSRLNITSTDSSAGDSAFALYNVRGVQVVDSQIHVAGSKTFELFNAQATFTNTATGASAITLDGVAVTNALAFYNQSASLSDSTVFGATPISLGGSTLSDGTSLTLAAATPVNFTLGTNLTKVSVTGSLTLNSTLNIAAGGGFGAGTFTLFSYSGSLSGSPGLGATPGGPYTYSFDTNTAGQVNLVVALPAPSAPTNFTATGTNLLIKLKWNAVSGATSYNLKRGIANGGPYPTVFSVPPTATNYLDALVTNAVTYYYVVTAVSGGESTNSLQASTTPLPSLAPVNITPLPPNNGQLQLSWPQDHLGWHLQIQTNSLNAGLGTNWVNVPNSTTTNQVFISIDPKNGSLFLRLVYP